MNKKEISGIADKIQNREKNKKPIKNLRSQLLATSATLEGIQKLINEFYYSSDSGYFVDPNTLEIKHKSKDVTGKLGTIVFKTKRGYRFELEESPK